MDSVQRWKPDFYDQQLGFVSRLGKGVVELLNPREHEAVLDLGCGTGDLTYEIAKSGAIVTGMDLSASMIEKARIKYPDLEFIVGDAERFSGDERFDAVFSNAALHWMKNASPVIEGVWHALKPGGRFVAEFGGKGNVETIVKAITETLADLYDIDADQRNPWFFPSIGEYSLRLEQQGFRVSYAIHFDRPTRLEDGDNGLTHWLEGFGDSFFKGLTPNEKDEAFRKIAEKVKPDLYHDDVWHADYKRIRIMALKP